MISRRKFARAHVNRVAIACGTTVCAALLFASSPAGASPFRFSTGSVTDQIATAARPGPASGPNQETESADDFVLLSGTKINAASFTGLLPNGVSLSDVSQVVVEIYRVFPKDSNVGRTSGPPTFSTPQVPTRVNSPSDVEFKGRDNSVPGDLSFSTTLLSGNFTALNSVDLGIHPQPGQTTGGDGPVTGQEVRFDVTFSTPLFLPADHYFFVPQVALNDPGDHFLWLSASKPILPPGTPFTPDLQSWIRNESLAPDWLRVGTDIVGAGPFNEAFSLDGATVPLPASWSMLGVALLGTGLLYRSSRRPLSRDG